MLTNMMINSPTQLNDFARREGVRTKAQLLPKLIERQELINYEMAKLIIEHKRPI